MADFGWSGDDADSIVLGWQPRTAVYETKGGGIVIRQEAEGFSDDHGDDQILLTPMGALAVAWKVIELAHAVGVPAPNRKILAKVVDTGPAQPPQSMTQAAQPPGPLLEVMHREAAE